MDYPLTPSNIHLYYDLAFVQEVERVLELNLTQPMERFALFLSWLRKGIQDLTDGLTLVRNEREWKDLSYQIPEIGTVFFQIIQEIETDETFIRIKSIQWSFKQGYHFKTFNL